MSNWYYADPQRQSHGPIDAEALAALFGQGQISTDTLVWREGLPQWQPLGDLAEELGLLRDAGAATPVEPVEPTTSSPDAGSDSSDAAATPVFSAHEPAQSGTGNGPAEDRGTYSPYTPPTAVVVANDTVVSGGEVVQAGLWKRFAASIIDSMVTGVLSYVVMIPLMLVFGIGLSGLGSSDPFAGTAGVMMSLVMYPISIGLPAVYFGWMYASNSQSSLGKMAVGVKVVRSDGQRLTFWRGFLRYLAYMLFTVVTCGLGVLICGLMVAFTERKQAPHDMICDTLVVDKWAFTEHPEWQRRELGTVTVVLLVIGGLLILLSVVLVVAMMGVLFASGHN